MSSVRLSLSQTVVSQTELVSQPAVSQTEILSQTVISQTELVSQLGRNKFNLTEVGKLTLIRKNFHRAHQRVKLECNLQGK
jgi:predicted XRE-type DNA-binding protein